MPIVAGVDFGTLSVRVTLVDTSRGRLGSGIGPEVPRDKDPAPVAHYRNPEVIISEVAPPIA